MATVSDPVTSHAAAVRRLLGAGAAVVAAVACAVAAASPASAHYSGGGLTSPQIGMKPYSYNSTWQGPMDQALTNWNVTPTRAYFFKSTGSASTVVAASFSDTWYGYYSRCGTACMAVRLNSRTISRDASNFSNFVTSVQVHEFGHALDLAHNTLTSIMNHGRNRNSLTTPQSHDISDVNVYYP